MQGLGQTEAMLTMLDYALDRLLRYDNAQVQFFMAGEDIITNMENYADHIHVAGRVTYQMAQAMPTGAYRLTAENYSQVLDELRQLVLHYEYDSIWQENPS